jgi:hypothetical protein
VIAAGRTFRPPCLQLCSQQQWHQQGKKLPGTARSKPTKPIMIRNIKLFPASGPTEGYVWKPITIKNNQGAETKISRLVLTLILFRYKNVINS